MIQCSGLVPALLSHYGQRANARVAPTEKWFVYEGAKKIYSTFAAINHPPVCLKIISA